MKPTLLLLNICVLFNFSHIQIEKSRQSVQIDPQIKQNRSLDNWTTLEKYVGTYPKETDFLKNPIIVTELKRILGSDYKLYLDHVAFSGCGQVIEKDKILIADISQLHVGGYTSLIFLNIKAQKGYLFWLSGTVSEKKYKIYGDKPVPDKILSLIVDDLNESWGHVANFNIIDGNIKIELK